MEGQRCNPLQTFEFASVADKPFEMDWTEWLDGAVLTSASVSVNGSTLVTVHDTDYTIGGSKIVRTWVRGANLGIGEALVTVLITTSDSRADARSWLFNVNTPGA